MAVNPATFTPGRGDDDWDGIDHRHVRDLADVARDFPAQQLKHFRDKETGQLVEYSHGSLVFYLSADGQEWCADCANDGDAEPPIIADAGRSSTLSASFARMRMRGIFTIFRRATSSVLHSKRQL
jgi:hypothetical protein